MYIDEMTQLLRNFFNFSKKKHKNIKLFVILIWRENYLKCFSSDNYRRTHCNHLTWIGGPGNLIERKGPLKDQKLWFSNPFIWWTSWSDCERPLIIWTILSMAEFKVILKIYDIMLNRFRVFDECLVLDLIVLTPPHPPQKKKL